MDYLKQNHLSILIIAFLVVSSLLGGSKSFGVAANVTTIGNPWVFSNTVTNSGAVTNSSTLTQSGAITIGTNGTAVNALQYGTCAIFAYATTIAASSTAQVDCSSTGRLGGTITGIASGDTVSAMATTSISSTFLGVKILAARASTTAGYLTLNLVNETGDTFTWTGAASSTIQYVVIR